MVRTRFLALLLVPLAAVAADGKGIPGPAWRLAPSDLALYGYGRSGILTVHGHDLRRAGQYFPGSLRRGDLPVILALRLPAPGSGKEKVELALPFPGSIPVRAKGTVRVASRDADLARIESEWVFTSRGREEHGLTTRIASGEARVVASFDLAEGVFRDARIEYSYVLVKLDPKPGEKPRETKAVRTYALKRLLRARHAEFQAEVDAAIDRGVAHLRTLQRKDGSYEPHGDWKVGTTALAALTLAACDVPRSDPALGGALDFIFGDEPPGRNYARALSLMAIDRAYTPPSELARERRGEPVEHRRDLAEDRRAWVERAAALLEQSPGSPGSWSYPSGPRSILKFDTSNTQYGVLGMRAAARLGYEVKERTWLGAVRHSRIVRERKGPRGSVLLVREGESASGRESAAATPVPSVAGFRYATLDAYERPYGSMTCAGIAVLAVARDQLRAMKSRRLDRALESEIEEMILGGYAWLDAHWAMDRHPEKAGAWYYYYLYSLERAAVLTRVREVGEKDWYYEGACQLIARQKKKGQWDERGGGDITETCFALLFLKRATAPVTPGPKER